MRRRALLAAAGTALPASPLLAVDDALVGTPARWGQRRGVPVPPAAAYPNAALDPITVHARRMLPTSRRQGYDYGHPRCWLRARGVTPASPAKQSNPRDGWAASPGRGADGVLAGRLPPPAPPPRTRP